MELDRVLAPNRVSHSVRRISISVHQEKNEYLKDNIEYTKMEEWPGKNIDILI
ncbi:MAG: hypothetical protein LBC27_02455 [Spirochaetaceae bacterium]|nr:hypothetical protein [Spirochaetaceae bacterium]